MSQIKEPTSRIKFKNPVAWKETKCTECDATIHLNNDFFSELKTPSLPAKQSSVRGSQEIGKSTLGLLLTERSIVISPSTLTAKEHLSSLGVGIVAKEFI